MAARVMAPGYGGRGGGFLSSLFGGIGGAMAGNWLYDQFSGRHHGGDYADNTSHGADVGNQGTGSDAGGSDWSGGGAVGDWGGDAGGGGDWGGGGDGGGGDWGGVIPVLARIDGVAAAVFRMPSRSFC